MIKTKKIFRTVISFLLCLTMVLPTGIVTFADEAIVCYIGTTGYASLKEAVANAADGDVIWMTADDSVSTDITVTKSITIELEGYTLSDATFKFDGSINAHLNDRKGTAKVNTNHNSGFQITDYSSSLYGAIYITNGAKLVISGSSEGTEFYGGTTSYRKTIGLGSESTLVINGAKILYIGTVSQDGIFVCKDGILTIGDVYVGRTDSTNKRGGALSYASAPSEEYPLTIKKGHFAAGMWLENYTTINGNYIPSGTISLANIERAFLYTSSGSYIDYEKTVDGTSDSNWDIWISSNLTTETEITDAVKDNTEALRVSNGGVINADRGQKIVIEPQVSGGNGSAITYGWKKDGKAVSEDKNYIINSFAAENAGNYVFTAMQNENSVSTEYTILENKTQIISKLYSAKDDNNSIVTRGVNENLYSSVDDIKHFAFVDLNDYDLTGVTTADYSADGDGSVKAWFDTDTSTLYVGGYGKIIAGDSLAYAFANAKYIQDIVGINMLDTSAVKDMHEMFKYTGRSSDNFTLDLGDNFDTSNVTDMSRMFVSCGYNSTVFTLNLGDKFDTSKVTRIFEMFTYCGYNSHIFTLNLGDKFDTGKATNMQGMFLDCGYNSTEFTLDLGNNFNTSNVKYMGFMFDGCGYSSKVFTLDLGNKFDTSNVTDMGYMFNGCGYSSKVFTLNLGNSFDTSKVTDVGGMFSGCGYSSTEFTLDLGDSFDTSNVKDMSSMFRKCGYSSPVFTLNLGDKFDTSKVTDVGGMFSGCGYSSTEFTLDLGNSFETSNVTDMSSMFRECGYSSTEFTLDLGNNFNTSNVTDMGYMFNGCGYSSTEFTLNLGNSFDTSNVTDMSSMFMNCGYSSTEFTLNLGNNFNTGNVKKMKFMFNGCGSTSEKFEALDLSNFTIGNETDLSLFAGDIPVTTFIFGEGWANAKLPSRYAFSSEVPNLKTTLIGATDNLLSYDWESDNRIISKPVIEYTITVIAQTGGTANGGGTVEEGAAVTLTAKASDGYIFDGWYDGETKVSDTAEFVVENVTGDKTYTAKFTENIKPLFDFTSVRTAHANSIVVDHVNKTISMNADSNVKYVTIYQNQLDIIPNGTIKLADSQEVSIKQNSGSFYIFNNAGMATVLVDVIVGDKTDTYSLSVNFTGFVADNLRMYQRKLGSTTKDIVYGTDVGYVVGNEIYITPEAGVEYIGITKHQGKPGNYKGIVTAIDSYPVYSTYEESIKAGDYIFIDWQECIFIRRPQNKDIVRFEVNYELDGESSIYTVNVDFSSSLDSEIKFSTIRTLRSKNIVVDHTNNTITMDSDGRVNNVAIFEYQSGITNGATITLADAKNAVVTKNTSSFYIVNDETGSASVDVNVKYGDVTKLYTLNVNFLDGFDFDSIRTLRVKNISVDHNTKVINMISDGKVSNVAVYQKQLDVIPDGVVKLANANGVSIKENAGSFYIEDDGNGAASVIVDITIGSVTKQYTLNVEFSDGFNFDEIRTLRASSISVDHEAKKIIITAESGAKNVALYMAQNGVINGGKLALKDEMNAVVQKNPGSYYIICPKDGGISNVTVDITIGNITKNYDVEVCFAK